MYPARRLMIISRWILLVTTSSLFLTATMATSICRNKYTDAMPPLIMDKDDVPANLISDTTPRNYASSEGSQRTDSCSSNGKEVCVTPGCVRAASMLLANVDFDQDPCDNFYKFACGSFIKNTIIPDDELVVTMITKTADMLEEQLRTVMEEPMTTNEPKPFRLVKDLYNGCMNTSRIEEIGITKLKQILKDLGGWPVLEGNAWDENSFDWKNTIYKHRDYGYSINHIFKLSVEQDLKNTKTRLIQIDQASLGLNSQYLAKGLKEPLVQAYYNYMVDVAVLLGANKAEAEMELKDSLLFESKLAKTFLPREQRRNMTKLYNLITIPELQQRYQFIPWKEYLTRLFPETVQIKPDEVVNVVVPMYFTILEAILLSTPNRVVANYLKWRVTAASITYLTESLRELQLEYFTVIGGITAREARWKECVDITSSRLIPAVGSLYVQRFFKGDCKSTILSIVSAIRAEMYKLLTEVDWMDEQTRQHALAKAKAMTEFIGYPDELLVTANLEEYYQKLELNSDSYLDSILNLTKFEVDKSFSKLREPYNKSDWIMHAETATVNAACDLTQNYIEFPAGLLQGMFFSHERPMYLNFAAIGCVAGHEMTHLFDDEGRQFDECGNLVDWWDPETEKLYLEKAACIIQQYGNYTVEEVGLKVNGNTTLGENIADNGGLKLAYTAYDTWQQQYGEEPRLPGFLDYSPHQMFWISAANIWCSKFRPEVLKLQINLDDHAPDEFRVIGPFSNRKEFTKDFNCALGTRMNPFDKCQVW